MRIIVDTNVFVSGIFWSGASYRILKAWQQDKISLVVSQEIIDEYERVGKNLSEKYSSIDIDIAPFLQLVAIYAEFYVPCKLEKAISRDSDDDKFIACALAANVKVIVSGDKDLLCLLNYGNIEILSPASFVKKYSKYLI
jgi:putative PIN family toxin of toxin-antitoxin system